METCANERHHTHIEGENDSEPFTIGIQMAMSTSGSEVTMAMPQCCCEKCDAGNATVLLC